MHHVSRYAALAFTSLAMLALPGCPSAPTTRDDAGTGRPCTNDVECDDSIACTIESCGVGGRCATMPLDALCTAPERCRVGVGCTTMMACSVSAECADAHDCTIDSCGLGGTCTHMGVNALCSGTAPFCSSTLGCVAAGDAGTPGCMASSECNDSVPCTVDTCGPTGVCAHAAMDALCTGTGARCDPTTGCFIPMPCTIDDDCQDGMFCNGRERCMPEFGCVPAMAPATCDDSQVCTTNRCDTTANMCVFECDTTMMATCGSHPACATAGTSCTGRFRLTADDPGVTVQNCASGMVDFDFSEVTFENIGPGVALTVTPLLNLGGPLSDNTAPVCPMIDARAGVTGMCPEQYILRGMFTDDDTFVGTFQFNGGGGVCDLLSGCRTATTPVTGTRIP